MQVINFVAWDSEVVLNPPLCKPTTVMRNKND